MIFIDELEAAPRGVLEVERERRDLRRRRLGLRLALGLALFQLGRQRDLDALLPFTLIDVAIAIRIQLLERGLEARRHQQVLEVRVAAGLEELDHLLVVLHGINNFSLLERAAPVGVDHAEDGARRVQELYRKFLVRPLRRALAPLLLDLELLDEAKRIRARIQNFVGHEMADRPERPDDPTVASAIDETRADFRTALEDDLNTSAALAHVHTFMTAMNRAQPGRVDAEQIVAFMHEVDAIFDILDGASAPAEDDEDDLFGDDTGDKDLFDYDY